MGFRITIDIDRPVPEVFAFLADGARTPLWYEAIERAEQVTGGSVSLGTRYRFARRLAGARVENLVEVSEYDVEKRLTLTSLEGPTPFTYRYALKARAAGTRLQLDGEISGAGLPGLTALLAPLAPRAFERGMHENLRVLKRILEGA